jgi:glycosyltransferase involved in cell wall biosynthesis
VWEIFHDRSRGRMFRHTLERRIYPLLLDRVFAGASRIVCNSRFLCTAISTAFPQYRDRLTTIYNGVDFDRYASGRRIDIPGVEAGDFVLLFVTSLNYDNKSRGLDLALDAFGRVRARARSAKLVIAAKTSSPQHRRGAEDAVAASASRDSIVLLFNSDSVPDLLASSHLFVFATPENSESLPRALLEAQASGLAAVATDTVGCGEIVRDGETGRLVSYDAGEMADAILDLMDSPAPLRAMAGQAAARVRETFSWGGMADRYADVFLDVGRRPAVSSCFPHHCTTHDG